MQVLDWVKW